MSRNGVGIPWGVFETMFKDRKHAKIKRKAGLGKQARKYRKEKKKHEWRSV